MDNPLQDWTLFAAWEERLAGPWQDACPFWDRPLTPQTRFLYYESTAPLPCCFYLGAYLCAPDWRLLAAELRHVVLPDAFGKYLCRHEWSDPRIPMPAEDLLEGARLAGWTEADGLTVIKQIVAAVDDAVASPDEAAGWPLLKEACRIFNEEWRTGSWYFTLRVLPSLEAVMSDAGIIQDGEVLVDDADDPEDPGLLYQRCFEDPEANQKLRDYLREYVRM
ncbi:MAG: hypothetical protein RMJ35_00390 [Phycisphaerales bacterium]|nr:hypothetical protein [Phycisphaerales bacterium]